MNAPVANRAEPPLTRVRDLSVTYQATSHFPVHALHHASIEIRPGEILGIVGESGSGKSTLAAALLRLLPRDARYDNGSIQFREHDLLDLPEGELRRLRGAEIALIPQDPALALNPVISVGDQAAEVIRAHSLMTRHERMKRVHELLSEVGFEEPQQIYPTYPHQLSGGQRQRIVIAQAIACRPALLIADEPTSKLDAALQGEILDLLRELARSHQMALVVIAHDPTVLAGLVDRVAVMYAGRIVEEGTVEDVFRRPLHPYTQALVGLASRHVIAAAVGALFPTINGEGSDLYFSVVGCPFASRCPDKMQICTEREPIETGPEPGRRVSCFKYGN